MDKDPRAAKSFYRDVRKFAETVKPWQDQISYETKPQQEMDITLVPQCVYDRRDEALAVMAAAGLDTADQPLTQRRLALPTEGKLYELKRRNGFESIAAYREDGAPAWL